MKTTLIDLIRHGEPKGGGMYRGHNIDHPLSDKGWLQMREAMGELAPWDQIISSPLQRCLAFAKEVSQNHNIPVDIEHELREVGFGSWEGKTREQLKQDNLAEYEGFYQDPVNCRPPGAEPLDDFIGRVSRAYVKHAESHQGKHLLIVGHAGVIRAIIAHTLHSQPLGLYRIKVDNGRITRIRIDQHGGHLLFHNARLQDM